MTVKIDSKIVSAQVVKDEPETVEPKPEEPKPPLKRPEVLQGETHKLTNHYRGYNLYLTVNRHEDKPFETFIDGSHTDATQWVKALSRLMSAMLRSHDPNLSLEFIGRELMMVTSDEGYHTGGKGGYVSGIVQHIGKKLVEIAKGGEVTPTPEPEAPTPEPAEPTPEAKRGETCPKCGGDVVKLDGCNTCLNCGDSKCG